MLLQVSLALVITYQMLTFADFDAVALNHLKILLVISHLIVNFATAYRSEVR